MLRVLARFAVAAAFVGVAAIPVTASAASGGGGGGNNAMTIVVGKPITLQARLLVTVPVTVTCPTAITIDPSNSQPGFITAGVEQAGRTTVAYAFDGRTLFTCSPTPTTYFLQVAPIPNSGPFHRGRAIVSTSGSICDTSVFPQVCYFSDTTWVVVKLV